MGVEDEGSPESLLCTPLKSIPSRFIPTADTSFMTVSIAASI
jgi:hypothetical protein